MLEWIGQLDPNVQTAVWVITVGAMTNTACALLGCYLVLRRMSLLGDALAHAVLPGLVIAFVLSGSVSIVYMFPGALLLGFLATVLIETLHRRGGVAADASMGVVFTSLFALGVILIRRYGQAVDLDPDCVLNGVLELVEINTVSLAGYEVPRALVTIAPVLLLNFLLIVLFWKELLISSFDPALADTMGLKAGLMHYLLMVMVAVTAVASFEQVGSILVIAMLIVPGATAHLLSDRLHVLMGIAAAIGVASAVLGHFAAVHFNTSTAGTMSVVVGLFYLTAVFLSPRYGILSTLWRNTQTSLRILGEDLLAMLYRVEEVAAERRLGPQEVLRALGGGLPARAALWSLLRRGQVTRKGPAVRLTESGRQRAGRLIRSHRLWETYLVEHLGLPPDHVHEPAARMEHFIDGDLQRQLATEVAQAETDPHGREIPREESRRRP